jgi:hypothetical protein
MVRRSRRLSVLVSNTVFNPALIAYFWIVVKFVWLGLALFTAFAIVAYKLGLFAKVREWPVVSRTALILGPILIATGIFFSTQRTNYWMIVPGVFYGAFAMVGGFSLRGIDLR